LWKSNGSTSLHSIEVGMWGLAITLRCEANASHKMKMNSINAVKDRRDPIEETTFHFINASG